MGSCESTESRSPLPGSPLGVRKKKGSRMKLKEELLQRIPGRMVWNGETETASIFTQQGNKGTNQDAMIVWENFCSRPNTVFCGVFDGHGPYGHLVAKRVRDSLPQKLSAHWEANTKSDEILREVNLNTAASNLNSEETSFLLIDDEARNSLESGKNPEVFQTLKESFLKAFKVMDRELRMSTNINSICSGTTAVTLVKQDRDLVIGNIGDSRAVLGTRDEHNSLIAVQLTVDLKPNVPAEAQRIRKCKGRVFALKEEPEVARVWLPNNDVPGLAMARAFGDFCLKDFGLISVPEITYRRITDKDEFIVLATDGIWDVLSNQKVVEIVNSCSNRSYAARALVETAVRAWRAKYPTSKVDDCAVVCLFLDTNESISLSTKLKENIPLPEPVMVDISGPTEVKTGAEALGEEDIEQISIEAGKDWLDLKGVARVNTLLTLPRSVQGKDDAA